MVRINPEKSTSLKTTKPQDLSSVLQRQKAAFNQTPNSPWADRKANIKKLGDVIKVHEADFIKAISEDFGHRAAEETILAETMVIQGGIHHAIKHTPHLSLIHI